MPVIEVRNLNKHYGDCLVLQDVTFTVETGILSLAGAEQHVRFRPSAPLDERLFADLPEVRRVSHSGDTVIVAGIGNLAHAVTSTLASNQIIAHELRIEQASLDDAFIALTEKRRRALP